MGFWTDLFEDHNYKLLQVKPIKIFTKLPRNYGRKEVNEELRKIRLFRNRINHNEPICFYENSIDFSKNGRSVSVHNKYNFLDKSRTFRNNKTLRRRNKTNI